MSKAEQARSTSSVLRQSRGAGSDSSDPRNTPTNAPTRAVQQAREFLSWTLNDVLEWNPAYITGVRGILNLLHVILSALVMGLFGSSCQLYTEETDHSHGLYCDTSDTFLFVIGCASFITSALFFFTCLLSKKADARLLGTTFEVVYYLAYFCLFFVASVATVASLDSRNRLKTEKEEYHDIKTGGIVCGFLNVVCYGLSGVWFYAFHKMKTPFAPGNV